MSAPAVLLNFRCCNFYRFTRTSPFRHHHLSFTFPTPTQHILKCLTAIRDMRSYAQTPTFSTCVQTTSTKHHLFSTLLCHVVTTSSKTNNPSFCVVFNIRPSCNSLTSHPVIIIYAQRCEHLSMPMTSSVPHSSRLCTSFVQHSLQVPF